jgi:hypothetical protein
MAEQLFFGKVENFSPTNRFTNLRADYVSGSNILTNVTASSGTLPWELMSVGQRIANTPELVGFAEILSFDSGSGTITLDQNATANATQNFTQWWVAENTYYVPSASFSIQIQFLELITSQVVTMLIMMVQPQYMLYWDKQQLLQVV